MFKIIESMIVKIKMNKIEYDIEAFKSVINNFNTNLSIKDKYYNLRG